MKHFLVLIGLVFFFSACSVNDDQPNFHYEFLPVEEVEIPQEFVLGETYQIKLWYYRKSTCHLPDGIYYEKDLNTRTVAVRNIVEERGNCQELTNELLPMTFNFYVTNNGTYKFKFWQGKNENNEDVYYEIEVPVVEVTMNN